MSSSYSKNSTRSDTVEGYTAILTESVYCHGCAFYITDADSSIEYEAKHKLCFSVHCAERNRKDKQNVIFIKNSV